MAYVCLGFSHESTPLSLREKLILDSDALSRSFSNFVLLSTRNRFEIYTTTQSASSNHQNGDTAFELLRTVSRCCDVDINELNRFASLYCDGEAAQHLFRVAAGLKSQIVGEPQILGQVSRALKLANELGHTDSNIRRLFRRAIKAGRRARTQTQIGHHSCSFATVSLKLASQYLGDIAGKNVLLLGAGSMASSVANQLKNTNQINVISRSLDSAMRLANKVGGEAHRLADLTAAIANADLVIASTSSNSILIDKPMVQRAYAERTSRPLVVVDLAVPRNVATDVDQIDGVLRFDIEDLNSILKESLEKRLLEVPQVEKILLEELTVFNASSQRHKITKSEWRRKLDDIRVSELARLQSNDALEVRVCDLMDRFSNALVERILEESAALIDGGPNASRPATININDLLDLDGPSNSLGGQQSDTNSLD